MNAPVTAPTKITAAAPETPPSKPVGSAPSSGDAIVGQSVRALAASIASGHVSAEEVVRAHVERIQRLVGTLNAVCVPLYDGALAEARRIDAARARGEALGPLAGVPITIKESLDVAGTPSTFGIADRHAPAVRDELHVARLRRAGAIPIAKTNVSQLLLYYEADNPVYGRTTNPWKASRTPGGSSGGEAALIATGGSPLGLGSDIGGSVRVPAAFCGLASLKPTAGRLPDHGRGSVPIGQQVISSQVGVLARSVGDVALGIEVANGGRAPDAPGVRLGDPATVDLAGLRVGTFEDDGLLAATPAARRAVREAAAALERRGARVVSWTPYQVSEGLGYLYSAFFADAFAGPLRALGKSARSPIIADMAAGATAPRALLPLVRVILNALGRPAIADITRRRLPPATDAYWRLVEQIEDYRARFAAALDRGGEGEPLDLVLCPPSPIPAFAHGASRELATMGSYVALWNVLGYPAGVVAVTCVRGDEAVARAAGRDRRLQAAAAAERDSAGLPMGVQVVARPWREDVALAAMAAIESDVAARGAAPRLPVDPRA